MTPGSRLGSYEVLAPIGKGGMGEVWKAHDTKLGRDVALKILPAAFASDLDRMARFEREARVLASLDHPNIAAIFGLEDSDGVRALVLALIDGPTLADRIAAGPIPLDEAIQIARQIAEAVEYAHERGVIHRDLKPANIKITSGGMVKVLDFGLAKALDDEPAAAASGSISPTLTMNATRAGVLLGTAAYMAPEQAKGKQADRRSDIWSFGVVLYEMVTRKPPFGGESVGEVIAAVIKEEPNLDAVPIELRSLVARCLNKDPRQRLQAIGEARIALEGTPGEGAPMPVAGRQPVRVWMGIAAAAVLAFAGLAVLHFREVPPAERALRLSIPFPESSTVALLALSPDGQQLAAGLIRGSGTLWIRKLDSSEFLPLKGSEGATSAFWSPDSRSIGFIATGKLKTIPATGGPPQVLCDAAGEGGGTWNSEGVILFSDRSGPILQVRASGGPCTPVTTAKVGSRHLYPEFLPDGKHFLYVIDQGKESDTGIYVAAIDRPMGKRLLPDISSTVFVPRSKSGKSDHFLFLRGTDLMAQPFDAQRLNLAGDVFPIASRASRTFFANNRAAASASATGIIAYLANGSDDREFQLTWFDRSGKQLANVERGDQRGVSLSPDEKFVAIRRGQGIWLNDLSRNVSIRFSLLPGLISQPVWSPDGHTIAFASAGNIYRKAASGGGQEELLVGGSNPRGVSDWSRDGKALLYTEVDPKTRANLWILPDPLGKAGSSTPIPFLKTEFTESEAQFSPDGHWIAYTSDEAGQFEVYVRPYPAAAGEWKISKNNSAEPRWRRDGKELYYMEGAPPRFRLMAVPVQAEGSRFQAGVPKMLFEFRTIPSFPAGVGVFSYSPSADGQRFLVSTFDAPESTLNVIVNWEKAFAGAGAR